MVAGDHTSRIGLAPINDSNFNLPPIKRLWGLFINLKMKTGKQLIPFHPYQNKTAINYIDGSGDPIDYCLTKGCYPTLIYAGYKYRLNQTVLSSSDHIPLVYKIE